ncbi:hypothetical protein SPRG_20305 [Saprolegnia parasitica CBS 223.65]|uniref:Uncharacterized protein n=1 Tax=Saprolegnia parasitica (strain CBS 223.65) TaxID=695850 RepID=A0A067C9V5_SAPPC|nr:hypothetical protein SPRG_20305 [Saprolegnia parasitica CBS 223.65]KDO27549.1 hypothetical protein SPRG_20305 [Saprolegnia parasitica CBS 223.65]|eukprot:XP_012201781.1 hypothetical protein SPRG_20305 [Saprolegnia parasitica CBS 223.65]
MSLYSIFRALELSKAKRHICTFQLTNDRPSCKERSKIHLRSVCLVVQRSTLPGSSRLSCHRKRRYLSGLLATIPTETFSAPVAVPPVSI